MSSNQTRIRLDLEVDSTAELNELYGRQFALVRGEDDLVIEVDPPRQGNGFGLTEVISIGIVIGTGVAVELVADAVRSLVKATIRRVRGRHSEADGSATGLATVISAELENEQVGPAEDVEGAPRE